MERLTTAPRRAAERRGNDGRMENEEIPNPVFLAFHRPWKSLRDSHISTAPTTVLALFKPLTKGVLRTRPLYPRFRLILR